MLLPGALQSLYIKDAADAVMLKEKADAAAVAAAAVEAAKEQLFADRASRKRLNRAARYSGQPSTRSISSA